MDPRRSAVTFTTQTERGGHTKEKVWTLCPARGSKNPPRTDRLETLRAQKLLKKSLVVLVVVVVVAADESCREV